MCQISNLNIYYTYVYTLHVVKYWTMNTIMCRKMPKTLFTITDNELLVVEVSKKVAIYI